MKRLTSTKKVNTREVDEEFEFEQNNRNRFDNVRNISSIDANEFMDEQVKIINNGVNNQYTDDYYAFDANNNLPPLLGSPSREGNFDYILTLDKFKDSIYKAAPNALIINNDTMMPVPVATPYHIFRQMNNSKEIVNNALLKESDKYPSAMEVLNDQNIALNIMQYNRCKFLIRSIYLGLVEVVNIICKKYNVNFIINELRDCIETWVINTSDLISAIEQKYTGPAAQQDKDYIYNEAIIPEVISIIYDDIDSRIVSALQRYDIGNEYYNATRLHAQILNELFPEFVNLQNNLMIIFYTIRWEKEDYFDKYKVDELETAKAAIFQGSDFKNIDNK